MLRILQLLRIFQIKFCLIQDLLSVLYLFPDSVDHADPWIICWKILISVIKMPIKTVKRAGFFAEFFIFFVKTTSAIITHFVNIICGRNIRFCANNTAIRKLAHSSGIGDFDPFDRIDINSQVPLIHLIRVYSCEQSKIPVIIRRWI